MAGRSDDPAKEALVIAVALSWYAFNVSATERARRLHAHFHGDCMDMGDLVDVLVKRGECFATEFPYPTALAYVRDALRAYHRAAREHVILCETADKLFKAGSN